MYIRLQSYRGQGDLKLQRQIIEELLNDNNTRLIVCFCEIDGVYNKDDHPIPNHNYNIVDVLDYFSILELANYLEPKYKEFLLSKQDTVNELLKLKDIDERFQNFCLNIHNMSGLVMLKMESSYDIKKTFATKFQEIFSKIKDANKNDRIHFVYVELGL